MTEASRDTQARKKGGKEGRERERERKRKRKRKTKRWKEGERRGKETGVPSYEIGIQGHSRERGAPGDTPKSKKKEEVRRKGEEREERLQQSLYWAPLRPRYAVQTGWQL